MWFATDSSWCLVHLVAASWLVSDRAPRRCKTARMMAQDNSVRWSLRTLLPEPAPWWASVEQKSCNLSSAIWAAEWVSEQAGVGWQVWDKETCSAWYCLCGAEIELGIRGWDWTSLQERCHKVYALMTSVKGAPWHWSVHIVWHIPQVLMCKPSLVVYASLLIAWYWWQRMGHLFTLSGMMLVEGFYLVHPLGLS